jgi:hypothetical protein
MDWGGQLHAQVTLPLRKAPLYLLNKRADGTQRMVWIALEKKKILPLFGI